MAHGPGWAIDSWALGSNVALAPTAESADMGHTLPADAN